MTIIGIVGNIVTDYYLLNSNDMKAARKKLANQGINFTGGPKQTNNNLVSILANLKEPAKKRLGGGGYNSLRAFLKISENNQYVYCDLSNFPQARVKQDSRVDYRFKNLSPVCQSLILPSETDRHIVKTERYDRKAKLSLKTVESIVSDLEDCNAVLVNSIANQKLAEIIGNSGKLEGKRKYIIVTKNLSSKSLRKAGIIKNSVAVIDIEEVGILGVTPSRDYSALEEISSRLFKLGARMVVITLGSEGAAYDDKINGVRIIRTKKSKEAEIQYHLKYYRIPKNGAGDYFAAGLVYHLEHGKEAGEAVLESEIFVVRDLLKYNKIKKEDFEKYPSGMLN